MNPFTEIFGALDFGSLRKLGLDLSAGLTLTNLPVEQTARQMRILSQTDNSDPPKIPKPWNSPEERRVYLDSQRAIVKAEQIALRQARKVENELKHPRRNGR
jgi:hypothetical protein